MPNDVAAETFEVKPLSSMFSANAEPPKAPVPAKVEEPKPAETPVAEPAKGETTGETPSPAATDAKPDATKPTPPKGDDPIKAMRKALNATQRELARLRQEKEIPPPPAPDPIADAEGFTKHIDQTISDRLWQERLADSHEDLSDKLGDAYEETLEIFQEMMKERPELYREWRTSRNPGKFLLKTVEDHKTRTAIGDPLAYAEKIRADTRKEMAAEVERMVAEGIKKALGQHLPASLADEQTQGGTRSNSEPTEFAPKPLGAILNKRK